MQLLEEEALHLKVSALSPDALALLTITPSVRP